ncbi:MAG: transporter substrate-binding domain-containing protein [Anaerolineae bacterium]|jgi:ABC-type amino acid transport substrate-binding protein
MDRKTRLNRRDFMLAASAGALGTLAVGCTLGAGEPTVVIPPTNTPAETVAMATTESTEPTQVAMATVPSVQTVEPRIDRVIANGVLRVGVDLTFPPLQFRDPDTNEPMGLMPEIDSLMAQDLGVELEYVEMPFGELIAGLLADKFDWIGIAFTSTPERAKQVLFIDEPTFFEDSVLLLRKGFTFESLSDLNSPDVTLSNMSGSAQDASARLLFPEANFKPLGWPETVLEVAAGRSDACLIAIWNAAAYINENPDTVDIWEGGSLFADVNTFFVPQGDYKTKEWIGNWFRYYGAHGWQQARFNYWIGELPGVRAIQEAWE